MALQTVAVLFGSRSPEHEVAVITALQVMENLDLEKYTVIPIYISKSGQWYLGDKSFLKPESYKNLDRLVSGHPQLVLNPPAFLSQTTSFSLIKNLPQIDIFFPFFHGSFGEDGTIQGLLEMLDVPYVGCSVLASALGMDKLSQKQIFSTLNLPQVPYVWFYRSDWQLHKTSVQALLKTLKCPLFVKPANGGSSIGVTKAKTKSDLVDAIDIACTYDRKIIVEQAAVGFSEINISVLGNSGSPLKTSVCEKPVAAHDLLTYQDKYQSGASKTASSKAGMASAQRLIPAPIKKDTAEKIADLAQIAYSGLDCSGLSRVDFLVSQDEKTIFINEINTIPGSLAFYLWEKSGLPFTKLLDELITLGFDRYRDRSRNTYTFSSNILANLDETLKTSKLKG